MSIISRTAEITKIEDHIRRASVNADAYGPEVAAAGQARLGPAIADIDAALAARGPAAAAETAAWAAVLREDEKSRVRVGIVRDAIWGALGRPHRSHHMTQVFPGGVATYTSGDPRRQPLLMSVLESLIAGCGAPSLTEEQRQGWIADIATARKAFEAALEKHRPTEAPAAIAEAKYRAAVRAGYDQLCSFKRDLETLGLSKAQIFDVIPDGGKTAAKAAKADAGKGDAGKGDEAKGDASANGTNPAGSSNDSGASSTSANAHATSKAA